MDRDLTDKAKEWLETLSQGSDNFIMSLGYKLPHLSWVTPVSFFEQFDGTVSVPDNMVVQADLPEPAFVNSAELRGYSDMSQISTWTGETNETLSDAKTIELRQAYYASVSYVDSLIGEVIQELKNQNLYDNTVIVVTADHGYHLGEHNMWTKNTNFELAVQVPLFISSPGYRSSARTTSELVELVDIFPTVIQLAGLPTVPICGETAVSRATELCTEGTSLVPLLTSDTEDAWNKDAVFHQYLRGNKMGFSIRTEEYRYTFWLRFDLETQQWDWDARGTFGRELYDLRTDTYENVNLAENSDYETIVNRLHEQLRAGAPIPEPIQDNTAPGENDTPSGGNDTPSGGNDTPSGENDTPSGGNDATSGENDENGSSSGLLSKDNNFVKINILLVIVNFSLLPTYNISRSGPPLWPVHTKNILHRMDIGWLSDRMGSYAILYSIHTHQMQKGWRLDLDRIESSPLTRKNI